MKINKTLKNIALAAGAAIGLAYTTGCASISQRGSWENQPISADTERTFWQNREDALGYLVAQNANDPIKTAGKTMANAWWYDRVKPFKAIGEGKILSGVGGVIVNPICAATGTIDAACKATIGKIIHEARGGNAGEETNELRAGIVDNLFVPYFLAERAVTGKSLYNIWNNTSRLWGGYNEAERVPSHILPADIALTALEAYLLYDCTHKSSGRKTTGSEGKSGNGGTIGDGN